MLYLIAGGLLGAAVAILTLPWSGRDPADFSTVELGYAWRGPRGAVIGALGTLVTGGYARRSRKRGIVRTSKPLPSGLEPLVRAVYGGLTMPRSVSALLSLKSVGAALPPIASRVLGARLRVGAARRLLGSLVALASPVFAVVGLARGDGPLGVGITVTIVSVLVMAWLLSLRGLTIAGGRTSADARRGAALGVDDARSGELVLGSVLGTTLIANWGTPDGGYFADHGGFAGGFDGGGSDGGSDGGGGDSNY
jgi:uncharacterized protein (TIGR04222 family)